MIKIFSKIDIQDDLRQVMRLNMQLSAKAEELARWREISEKAPGIFYSHTKAAGENKSRIEENIVRITSIENSIQKDVQKLLTLKDRLSRIIETIGDPTSKTLLSLRYLSGMNWEQVAEFMDYSYVHVVHRLHPKALKKLSEAEHNFNWMSAEHE
jgi:DNA-directed RNA polymerase specialized sigma subunit